MFQVILSFFENFSENRLFISANTLEKYIVSKEFCIVHHDDKMCFLLKCSCHKTLLGGIKEFLQKLDALFSTYQHVDCLYTLFKYQFIGDIFVKSGQFFYILQKAVHFNH